MLGSNLTRPSVWALCIEAANPPFDRACPVSPCHFSRPYLVFYALDAVGFTTRADCACDTNAANGNSP